MKEINDDRRRVHRYRVNVPIDVKDIGRGRTFDISASGVSFHITGDLKPGSRIRFELTLTAHGVRLQCEGRVVRVDATGSVPFAAATIESLERLSGTEH